MVTKYQRWVEWLARCMAVLHQCNSFALDLAVGLAQKTEPPSCCCAERSTTTVTGTLVLMASCCGLPTRVVRLEHCVPNPAMGQQLRRSMSS